MAELSEEQKETVVRLLAEFKRPAEVVAYIQDAWGTTIDRFQVRTYDPTNARFEAGERYRAMFEAVRASFLDDLANIPISHQGFRLNLLNEMALKAMHQGNLMLASRLLEQAAKEVGGLFSARRELRVEDTRKSSVASMTPEERKQALAEVIRQAMDNSSK